MTKWKPLLWTVHLSGWNGREQSGINRYFLFSSLLLFTVGLVGTLYTFHLTAGDCELIGHACMAHRCQNEAPCMQADIDMLTHESPHTPHECTNKTQMNFCVNYTQKRMHGEYKLEKNKQTKLHRIFLAPGSQIKAQSKVWSRALRVQTIYIRSSYWEIALEYSVLQCHLDKVPLPIFQMTANCMTGCAYVPLCIMLFTGWWAAEWKGGWEHCKLYCKYAWVNISSTPSVNLKCSRIVPSQIWE